MDLLISTQGLVRALYSEAIPLSSLGPLCIARASQVDADSSGQWWADLALSGGPVLGPFPQRSLALQAEQDWLQEHVLFNSTQPLTKSTFEHDTRLPPATLTT